MPWLIEAIINLTILSVEAPRRIYTEIDMGVLLPQRQQHRAGMVWTDLHVLGMCMAA